MTIEPLLQDWSQHLALNVHRPDRVRVYGAEFDRNRAKRQILRTAVTRAHELQQLAGRVRLGDLQLRGLGTDVEADLPIVMTGHQPIVFHRGIQAKYETTSHAAGQLGAVGMALSIDTDLGDPGQFQVPLASDGPWKVAAQTDETLSSQSDGMFFAARVAGSGQLMAIRQRVTDQLVHCKCQAAAESFCRALDAYLLLADQPMTQAHALVRCLNRVDLLEISLSQLSQAAEVERMLIHIAVQGSRFAFDYNQTLDDWRAERKLRNAANPFPNLRQHNEAVELPMWVVNRQQQTRAALWVRPSAGKMILEAADRHLGELVEGSDRWPESVTEEHCIVPRAALITFIARTLCSDLFVHGLGGRTYDQYTDRLIEIVVGHKPPKFCVVSESRYLFPAEMREIDSAEIAIAGERDVTHHPERHLASPIFSQPQRQQIEQILDRKSTLVAVLRDKKAQGVSAAQEGRELQAIQDRLKEIVAEAFSGYQRQLDGLSTTARAAIFDRTYPWFFFDGPETHG